MDSPPIMNLPPNESPSMKSPPALPVRSSLRPSSLLDPMAFKNALQDEQPPLSPVSAPHDVYLSSEEDASSSADDFSDYEGSESDLSLASPYMTAQQDTARVVSVIYHGKPSLVNLSPRSTSPATRSSPSPVRSSLSSGSASPPVQEIPRSSTVSDLDFRRVSVASTASSSFFNFSRSSTMTLGSTTSSKPSFLSIDPFAARSGSTQSDEIDRPKTPTGILKRKLTLSRKKSKPLLNEEPSSRPVSYVQAEAQSHLQDRRPSTPRASVNYQDIMKAARGSPASATAQHPPPPPEPESAKAGKSAKGARSRLRNLSISRKLSVKS